MANENGKTPTQAQPQMIPLSKIHELPGVFNPKPQDKSLGSMVLSIESSGIKEPVILRQRDDGEYQLLSGYRRRRASELAKKQDIPAHVYEMTVQEAIVYRKAVKNDPNAPIPGKLVDPSAEKSKTAEATPPVAGEVDHSSSPVLLECVQVGHTLFFCCTLPEAVLCWRQERNIFQRCQ